jgi:hypothetical protein
VPRIPNEFLDVCIYLYPTLRDARNGVNLGASGFLVGVELENHADSFQIYAVTNKHVVKDRQRFIRLNRTDGKVEILKAKKKDWILHPDGDDLAVFPIELPAENLHWKFIGTQYFLTMDMMNAKGMGPGDDVFMVGRFMTHDGKQRNTPSVRFGNIAMMPFEKMRDEETGQEQEAFLVECRSIPGYSGSPVFLFRGDMVFTRNKFVSTLPDWPWFLGVDFCHLPHTEVIRHADGKPFGKGLHVLSNTGMAGVIPAWRLLQLLNVKKLVKQREKEDEILTKLGRSRISLD